MGGLGLGGDEQLVLEIVVDGLGSFKGTMDVVDRRLDKSTTGFSGLAGVVSGALSTAFGIVLVKAVGLALDAIKAAAGAVKDLVGDSLEAAKDFESTMVDVKIAAGLANPVIEDLDEAALALGRDFDIVGIDAGQAAEGLEELYLAGLDTETIFGPGGLPSLLETGTAEMGAFKLAADLAAATDIEFADAMQLSVQLLSTFGQEAETAQERVEFLDGAFGDIIASADNSIANVSDFTAAMKNVGPTAAGLGYDIDEVAQAIGILSDRGIQGAEAGTALRRMLANLNRDTKKVNETNEELGVSLFDTNGALIPLADTVDNYAAALVGMTEEERANTVQTLAGVYGQNAFNALISEGSTAFEDLSAEVGNYTTLQDRMAAKLETAATQQERLEGVTETFKIQLGNALLPALTTIITTTTDWLEKNDELIQDGLLALQKIVEGPVMDALALFADFLDEVPGYIETLLGWWQTLSGSLDEGSSWIEENVMPVLNTLREWFDQISPVIQDMVVTYIYGYMIPAYQALWTIIQEDLLPPLLELADWFGEKMPPLIEQLTILWETYLKPAFTTFADFMTGVLMPVVGALAGIILDLLVGAIKILGNFIFDHLVPALVKMFTWIGENVVPVIQTLVTWLKDNLVPAFEIAQIYFGLFLDLAVAFWDYASNNLLPILEGLWDQLKTIAEILIDNVVVAVTSFWDVLISLRDFVDDKILTLLTEFYELVRDSVIFWIDLAVEAVQFFVDIWLTLWNVINDIIQIFDDVVSLIGEAADAFLSLDIPDWLKPGSPPPLYYALRDISGMMDEISSHSGPNLAAAFGSIPAPGGLGAPGGLSNSFADNRQFNLETNTLLGPGDLALEFREMQLASR